MTPQEAYEKRYSNLDNGQHTWEAAPPHVKDMWLAAWTIAWAIAEATEREECAKVCEEHPEGLNMFGGHFVLCAQAIRARSDA